VRLLIGEGVTEETADAWLAAWAAKAEEDGLERGPTYWPGGLGLDRWAAEDEEAADIHNGPVVTARHQGRNNRPGRASELR
jgi:hypothetical protein